MTVIVSAHTDAHDDRVERLLRLEALQLELHQRGKRARVRPETPTRWVLLARSRPWPWPHLRVYCVGAENTFVFVTAQGRILANADPAGVRGAATRLARP